MKVFGILIFIITLLFWSIMLMINMGVRRLYHEGGPFFVFFIILTLSLFYAIRMIFKKIPQIGQKVLGIITILLVVFGLFPLGILEIIADPDFSHNETTGVAFILTYSCVIVVYIVLSKFGRLMKGE